MKTFPMFLKMAERHVVIAGGGEQAAQKARLILKTEARITLLAKELDPELTDLVETGRATQDTGPVGTASFQGAALVFIATGCVATDVCLHALARAAGAVVNVVDQPDLCDAYTPSIVDRDPVVVAIGTEGNAPVLGRQIKTQVEQLLEPRLGDFARLAGRLRDSVARHVRAEKRRDFWRWMFAGEPRQLHARGSDHRAARLLKEAVAEGRAPDAHIGGALSLLEAGAGAPDLLTLRAVQRLQEADVIYISPGIAPEILEYARRDAERVWMNHCEAPRADGLSNVVAADARNGRVVVQLVAETVTLAQENGLLQLAEEGVHAEIVAGIAATRTVPSASVPMRKAAAF